MAGWVSQPFVLLALALTLVVSLAWFAKGSMLHGTFKGRFGAYAEILIVSSAWFAFVGYVLISGLKWLQGQLPGQTQPPGIEWPVVIAFLGVFLLPYLVVAAAVWGVNVSIAGAKAERVPAAEEKTQPEAGTISGDKTQSEAGEVK